MKITKEVMRVFELLHGPDCNDESAIGVIADFIRNVCLEVLLYHQKLLILDLALNALTTVRPGTPILTKLKRALHHRFMLAPQVLRTIFPNIDLWDQQRLLKGGLLQSYKI